MPCAKARKFLSFLIDTGSERGVAFRTNSHEPFFDIEIN